MEPLRIIRTDLAASVLAHLTLIVLIIVLGEVHPFHAAPTETVTVDIVSPDDVKDSAPEPPPQSPPPTPDVQIPDLAAVTKTEAAGAPSQSQAPAQPQPDSPPQQPVAQQQQQPQQQPQPNPPVPSRQEANAQPQPQSAPQAPGYHAPEPDITVKYGVMLGLPDQLPALPQESGDQSAKNDGGDGEDQVSAKLPASVIADLRRHLKSCANLPASISPSDNVRVKLRAVMTTDGMLARPPILVEASASAKGPILMQSAMKALQACQPYTMLPADKYQEWKVLDLSFTPRDLGAS